MVLRLKTLFFILALSASVFSGTPLGDTNMKENVCPMKCCKKNSAKSQKPKDENAKFLCRVLVCSETVPTNAPSNVQINLAPIFIASERISFFEILFSTTPKDNSKVTFESSTQPRQILPKFIQHQRILI